MKEEYIDCKGSTIIEHYNNRCVFCGTKTRSSNINICDDCLKKYKNRDLLIKVDEIRTTVEIKEIIEKYNDNNIFRCKDGHKVKSEEERTVDNYLYEHGIVHAYEFETNDNLHPDFYIPKYDVYIEYWSSACIEEYFKQAFYKLKKYCDSNLTILGLYRDDLKNGENIEELIKNAKPNKLNRCKKLYELFVEYTGREIKNLPELLYD